MPLTSILIVSGIVAAFVIFGLTLAWGEIQTRNLVRNDRSEAARAPEREEFKKAA